MAYQCFHFGVLLLHGIHSARIRDALVSGLSMPTGLPDFQVVLVYALTLCLVLTSLLSSLSPP